MDEEATTGHNSALTPDENKALLFHHLQAITKQKARVDEEQREYKRLRKLAKADNLVLADIDFAMRCADLEDPSIVPAELQRRMEIAAWFALPVNYQADIFADVTPALERIEKEGEAAGLAGKDVDFAGFAPGSPEQQASHKGWDRGQKILLDNLTSAQEKVGTADDVETLVKRGDLPEGEADDPFEDAA